MKEIFEMTTIEFLELRISTVDEELSDLIYSLEVVAGNPADLAFTSGRITEMHYELKKMKQFLADCIVEEAEKI